MCIACNLKLWFTPSEALTNSINSAAAKLKGSTAHVTAFAAENENLFKQLRKAKPEITKLLVQAAALKEEKPELQDLYQPKQDDINQINVRIYSNASRLLSEIDGAMQTLLGISLDSIALIKREDKRLAKLIKKIMALKEEPQLKHELILRLNTVKENIKSTVLKLLEAARFQEKKVLSIPSPRRIKLPIAERIGKLGIDISALENALAKLGIKDIDELVQDAEKEIGELKEIELDSLLLMPSLEGHLIKLRKSVYILEESTSRLLGAKLDAVEKNFNRIAGAISSKAQNLFEGISIVRESK